MKYSFIFLFIFLTLTECRNIPADPEDSFRKASSTGLKVGYAVNPPWVMVSGDSVYGIEVELVRKFAEANGMKIIWKNGPEQVILKGLKKKQFHIVISGLTMDSPWKKEKIGLTRPYFRNEKEKHVIAILQGENRLLYNLEKHLFSNKDSINALVYREYDKYNHASQYR
ncbi:MAG TPA: transporter substrate-binding domain-containing protein [Bacteroidales bacterium]|jgi:ABC-type amino acid transport substrate-binding protein|nr:transporter substrate-binding domain-containing protein [Bacteroidales bacterium]